MMKRILGMLSLLLILVLGLFSCTTDTGEDMLEDTIWVLKSYGEPGNLKAIITDTEITAEFVSAEETVEGSAGCNTYFGDYEINGDKIYISEATHTEIGCMEPEGVMDQEQDYLTALQSAESYEINGDELQINCGSQILIFKK